jgi:hypothetical protein
MTTLTEPDFGAEIIERVGKLKRAILFFFDEMQNQS